MHQDKKQVTPLQFAKRNNKHQIVELLLANGATPPTDAKKRHMPLKLLRLNSRQPLLLSLNSQKQR